jgi:hypothetical protein
MQLLLLLALLLCWLAAHLQSDLKSADPLPSFGSFSYRLCTYIVWLGGMSAIVAAAFYERLLLML